MFHEANVTVAPPQGFNPKLTTKGKLNCPVPKHGSPTPPF